MSTDSAKGAQTSCLVIGGLGFLGSRIAIALVQAGHRVRVFDRVGVSGAKRQLQEAGAEILLGDIANEGDVARATTGVECVFHSAYASVPRSASADPAHDLSANALPLIRLLAALESDGVCRQLIYLSSGGTVYGRQSGDTITELHPTNPISAYGVSKLACEKYIQLYAGRSNFDAAILRLSNPYGPGQNVGSPQGVVGHFLHRIAKGKTLEVWGDGTVVRDYFFADDLRSLAPLLVGNPAATGVFNIGSGQGRSLNDVVATIRQVVDVPVDVTHFPAQQHDAPTNVLNVTKARDTLEWEASTEFAEGVASTWRHTLSEHE